MLYRFPISIYIIFSRLRHPQTLAASVHWRSFGKTALFVHRNILRATQTVKETGRNNQNPQTFVFRLDMGIYPTHKLDTYLEAISFFS